MYNNKRRTNLKVGHLQVGLLSITFITNIRNRRGRKMG